MKLNHLNLVVPHVSETSAFFETYFGLRCLAQRGQDTFAILTDETGFILTLSNLEKVDAVEYPGIFHIGFNQDSRERVDEIYQRLTADGFQALPPRKFHGAWTFYVDAPGGVSVEVAHQIEV
jgi:catechol 2,3-dioxygenase-like lactoylglutathione lyase family enzyme